MFLTLCVTGGCVAEAATELDGIPFDDGHLDGEFGTTEQPIVFGELDRRARFEAIVALTRDQTGGDGSVVCSGIVVAPTLILTAAHCQRGAPGWVHYGSDTVGFRGHFVAIAEFTPHPAARPAYDGVPVESVENDFAIVRVEHPIGVTPLPLAKSPTAWRFTATAVGYGCTQFPQPPSNTCTGTGERRVITEPAVASRVPRFIQMLGPSRGDSGGALIVDDSLVAVLVGYRAREGYAERLDGEGGAWVRRVIASAQPPCADVSTGCDDRVFARRVCRGSLGYVAAAPASESCSERQGTRGRACVCVCGEDGFGYCSPPGPVGSPEQPDPSTGASCAVADGVGPGCAPWWIALAWLLRRRRR